MAKDVFSRIAAGAMSYAPIGKSASPLRSLTFNVHPEKLLTGFLRLCIKRGIFEEKTSLLVYSELTMLLQAHPSGVYTPLHKISVVILTSLCQPAQRSATLVPRPLETLDQTAVLFPS